mgnify:CR=1 FL=1
MCIIFLLVQKALLCGMVASFHMILWQAPTCQRMPAVELVVDILTQGLGKSKLYFEYFCNMQLVRAAYLVYSALKDTEYCGIAVEWWHSDCIKLRSSLLPPRWRSQGAEE